MEVILNIKCDSNNTNVRDCLYLTEFSGNIILTIGSFDCRTIEVDAKQLRKAIEVIKEDE